MAVCSLAVIGAACIYGIITVLRPKTPLFYKIVVYGFCSYFLALVYSILYVALFPANKGFHVGVLGYAGTFFFLFSSYFGALDRLADGGEAVYRGYRITALIPAAFIVICGADVWDRILMLPIAGTAYFSCKHLILPDVDMGIIRVMRPYNTIILLFCLIQPFVMKIIVEGNYESFLNVVLTFLNMVLAALAMPVARREVQKWFI